MPRTRLAAFLTSLAVVASVATPAAAAEGWSTTRLTSNAADHYDVSVSENRVVWTEVRGDGRSDVYTQRVWGEASARRVSLYGYALQPRVSGERIAWIDSDGTANRVYTQRIGLDARPVAVSVSGQTAWDMDLSGDRLVWADTRGVWTRKMGVDAAPVLVTSDYYRGLVLSGDRAAWVSAVEIVPDVLWGGSIRTMRIGVDTEPRVLEVGTSLGGVQISGERLAWASLDSLVTLRADVQGSFLNVDLYPAEWRLSGDRIVWRRSHLDESGGTVSWNVFTLDAGVDTAATMLTSDDSFASNPDVSGDRVVWEDRAGLPGSADATGHIVTQKIGAELAPITLTTDQNDHTQPRVSGDRVVWRGFDGAHWQVFTAAPSPEPRAADVLSFFDAETAADPARLVGTGPASQAAKRAAAFRILLADARYLIEQGRYLPAISQLRLALSRCDGASRPADLVTGTSAPQLAERLRALIIALGGTP